MLVLGALALIVLLGAGLRFYQLGAHSIGNAYYAATVKSMLTSWHNFFFASFEPGGSVSVDKPPVGFWIQCASAGLLGVNGFALALPQALAGVLSILVLYRLVRRSCGPWAGLAAALTLAVMPVAVSTERNNTIDGLLVLVLLLAAWAFLRAAEKGSLLLLLLGALLVGLGFNIKMLQAFLPLPAFYVVCLLGPRTAWWKRLLHLAAATALLLVVSLSWAVAVDLTPADSRPYVGSSTDNSVLQLITGHNGLARLGLFGGPQPRSGAGPAPGAPAGPQNPPPPVPSQPNPARTPGPLPNSPSQPAGPVQPGLPPRNPPGPGTGMPNPGGVQPGGSSEVGQAGPLRLFVEPLVSEASWLLPAALLGVLLVLVALGRPWPLQEQHRALLLWAGWLLPEALYFSFNSGLFHAYYLIMLGPPLAALVGAAAWALSRLWTRRPWPAWGALALLSAATLFLQMITLRGYPAYGGWIPLVAVPSALLGLTLLAWRPRRVLPPLGIGLLLLGLFLAPLVWSVLTALNPNPNVALPRAGPAAASPGQDRPSPLPPTQQRLTEYLLAHTRPDSYLFATLRATEAAPYIVATGRPVLAVGGFSGGDNVAGVEELAAMVAAGNLRYFLGGWEDRRDIATWLERSCCPVALPAGIPAEGRALDIGLYDCECTAHP